METKMCNPDQSIRPKAMRWLLDGFLALFLAIAIGGTSAMANDLPTRQTPIPVTTSGVPHVQLNVQPVPEVQSELMRRVALLPGVNIRPTVISLPGATGFQLDDALRLKRPDVIVGGREFAHVHPDGSLHASLPPERAKEAVWAGWAVRHPWAAKRQGWEGFVMLYTPSNMDELEVTFQLIVDGYNFVTGRDLLAENL